MKTINLFLIIMFIPNILCMNKKSKSTPHNNVSQSKHSKQTQKSSTLDHDKKALLESLQNRAIMLQKQNENLQSELAQIKKNNQNKQQIIEKLDWRLYRMQQIHQDLDLNLKSHQQIIYQSKLEYEELYKYTCRIESSYISLQTQYQEVKNKLLGLAAYMVYPMIFFGYNVTYVPEQLVADRNIPSTNCQEPDKEKNKDYNN